MLSYIYKKLIIDFSKFTLFLLSALIIFSLFQAKNFNLDASSDALLLEGDKDLKYLREINERYGSKEFLVLTYSPVSSFTKKADIVIVALGIPNFLKSDMIKQDSVVIDVGITRVEDKTKVRGYRIVGDVDFESVKNKVSHITPVPGGVGPMTIAMLLKNTLKARKK